MKEVGLTNEGYCSTTLALHDHLYTKLVLDSETVHTNSL